MKIVDPELTTDGIALWKTPDEQFHQIALGTGGEFTVGTLPEFSAPEFVALIKDSPAEHILNGEMRTTCALQVCVRIGPVIGAELIDRIGLDGYELINTSFVDSGTVKGDAE